MPSKQAEDVYNAMTPEERANWGGREVENKAFSVGDLVKVGEFFWIQEELFIGFKGGQHGQGVDDRGGSVDTDCTLEILDILGAFAVVRLNRNDMPFGAEAPIGSVFQIPIPQMESWPEKLGKKAITEKVRRKLAKKYCD